MLRPDLVPEQHRADGLPGRVVFPVALRHCPPHHRPDPIPHLPGRGPFLVPQQDRHHVPRADRSTGVAEVFVSAESRRSRRAGRQSRRSIGALRYPSPPPFQDTRRYKLNLGFNLGSVFHVYPEITFHLRFPISVGRDEIRSRVSVSGWACGPLGSPATLCGATQDQHFRRCFSLLLLGHAPTVSHGPGTPLVPRGPDSFSRILTTTRSPPSPPAR